MKYAQAIEVYYLIVAWTLIAALGMYFHTATPLGRMANACRDNHERAQFVGYDPRIVRFLQFALSGFYAGIAGGLFAITYEIVTFDAVAAPLAANALLMAYIGGATTFVGPVLGAILITLSAKRRQPDVEFLAGLCRRAVHRDGDLRAGRHHRMILGHAPILRAGLMRRLLLPYSARPGPRPDRAVRLDRPGGTVILPHDRQGAGQAPGAVRPPIDIQNAVAVADLVWSACSAAASGLRVESRQFKRVWDGLIEIARPGGRR